MFGVLNLLSIQNSNKESCGLLTSDSEYGPNRLLAWATLLHTGTSWNFLKIMNLILLFTYLQLFLSQMLPTGLKDDWWLSQAHPSCGWAWASMRSLF